MRHGHFGMGFMRGPVDSEQTVQTMTSTSSGNETGEELYDLTSNDDLVNTAGNLAQNSVDNTLSKISDLMGSSEVQNVLKGSGLDIVVKNTSREAVKNILALMGIWYVSGLVKNSFKNKYVVGGVGLAALALYFKSSQSTEIMKELNGAKKSNNVA